MIKILENNELDISSLEVSDIINIDLLQKFQDNFAFAMNCASITVNRNGEAITKESCFTKFCNRFIHSTKKGNDGCAASHRRMGNEASKMGTPYVGPCHAGLIDFAAPITIEGEIIGTVLGGQILDSKPKAENFIKIAKELNIDENGILDAVNNISVSNIKNIEAAAEVLFIVVNTLAKNGFNELKLSILSKKLSDNFLQISATIEELSASALDITEHQEKLNGEINEVNIITSKINDILYSIKKIAGQIKMLGLNASIEASRAGEIGKGFGVVASEIKKLSESSRETAEVISNLTNKIENSVAGTIGHSNITLETTKEQSKAMEDVNIHIQEAVLIANQLNNLIDTIH